MKYFFTSILLFSHRVHFPVQRARLASGGIFFHMHHVVFTLHMAGQAMGGIFFHQPICFHSAKGSASKGRNILSPAPCGFNSANGWASKGRTSIVVHLLLPLLVGNSQKASTCPKIRVSGLQWRHESVLYPHSLVPVPYCMVGWYSTVK